MQAPSGVRDVVLLRLSAPILARLPPDWPNPAKSHRHCSHGGCTPDLEQIVTESQTHRLTDSHPSWSRSQSYHHKQPVPRMDRLGDSDLSDVTWQLVTFQGFLVDCRYAYGSRVCIHISGYLVCVKVHGYYRWVHTLVGTHNFVGR